MDGVSKETQMSIATASSMFPGFRFCPTDVELISYYLKKKIEGCEKFVEVISEVEICRYEPWDLPAQSIMQSDNEWFFFSSRGRKYPKGSQSRRATELGYWKATGKERNVKSGSDVIGTKRTLVFHLGRAPKGERTEWIMHEYCMSGASQDSVVICRLRRNSDFHLNNPSNRASASRGHSQTLHATSENLRDLAGLSDGSKPIDCNPKRSSSSYDSHSSDQVDSASNSSQQLIKDYPPAESSSQQKCNNGTKTIVTSKEITLGSLDQDCYGEEDCYADILKDDIIKLDDSSTSATWNLPPAVANPSKEARKPQQRAQPLTSQALPLQGTANRRIRLKKLEPPSKEMELPKSSCEDYNINTISVSVAKQSPRCLYNKSSAMIVDRHLLRAILVLTILVLLLSVLSNLSFVKRITFLFVQEPKH